MQGSVALLDIVAAVDEVWKEKREQRNTISSAVDPHILVEGLSRIKHTPSCFHKLFFALRTVLAWRQRSASSKPFGFGSDLFWKIDRGMS
jgi:hypothetical protein